jgi:cell division protein FtsN
VITYHSPRLGAMVGAGSYRADKRRMRYFVVVALIVLGVIFLRQKKAENSAPQKTTEAVAQATLTPRPASEHDWAKAAIDRTNEVRQKVKRERASNEVP